MQQQVTQKHPGKVQRRKSPLAVSQDVHLAEHGAWQMRANSVLCPKLMSGAALGPLPSASSSG